jgi:hypothetical protein
VNYIRVVADLAKNTPEEDNFMMFLDELFPKDVTYFTTSYLASINKSGDLKQMTKLI